jgi:uncharacterized protein with ATP-grasp and redox domains
MKLSAECVPCLLKRAAYEVELCAPGRAMEALRECSSVVAEKASERISSAEFASAIHQCAYAAIGKDDPYSDLKKRSNEVALGLLPVAEVFVRRSKNPLIAAMRVSIIGNLLDFGIEGSIGSPEALKKTFKELMNEPLGSDNSEEIERMIEKSKEIVFLADNCGEIVFDKILLREIKRNRSGRIVLVIKGRPILTDVTKNDMRGLGIENLVDEILETEDVAVGINLWEKGKNSEIARRLRKTDLIISKGMANFEALSEYDWKAIAYLLRVKCGTVARAIDAPIDTNVIKLVRDRKKEKR